MILLYIYPVDYFTAHLEIAYNKRTDGKPGFSRLRLPVWHLPAVAICVRANQWSKEKREKSDGGREAEKAFS